MQFSRSSSTFLRRQLALTNEHLRRSFERLSGDPPEKPAAGAAAGRACPARLREEITPLANLGRDLAQGLRLAESATARLNQVSALVRELCELATRAADAPRSASDRALLQVEFQGLASAARRAIDRLGLFGTDVALTRQLGSETADSLAIRCSDLRASAAGLAGLDLTTLDGERLALTGLNTLQGKLADLLGTLEAGATRLATLARSASARALSLTATGRCIRSVDMAGEAARLARNPVLQAAGVALLARAHGQNDRR